MNIEEMECEYDMELMSRALSYLDGLPQALQNSEYKKIIELINNYLKNCKHKIVEDYIDTDPDTTKRILYCEYCNKTF
jgi:hypothetical protein